MTPTSSSLPSATLPSSSHTQAQPQPHTYGDPAEALAARLRADIAAATGCTASAGIGPNMLVARLATRRAKPNGQFRVRGGGCKCSGGRGEFGMGQRGEGKGARAVTRGLQAGASSTGWTRRGEGGKRVKCSLTCSDLIS